MGMMRIVIGIGLFVAFIGWLFYRIVVTKDLKKNLNELYVGLFVLAFWGLIYWFLFT